MAIIFNGKALTVRQLTVREISHYLAHPQTAPRVADLLMNDPIPSDLVLAATGLNERDLEADTVTPDGLHQLWEAVATENPICAALLTRLVRAGEQLLEEKAPPASAGQPAPSPAPDTAA